MTCQLTTIWVDRLFMFEQGLAFHGHTREGMIHKNDRPGGIWRVSIAAKMAERPIESIGVVHNRLSLYRRPTHIALKTTVATIIRNRKENNRLGFLGEILYIRLYIYSI